MTGEVRRGKMFRRRRQKFPNFCWYNKFFGHKVMSKRDAQLNKGWYIVFDGDKEKLIIQKQTRLLKPFELYLGTTAPLLGACFFTRLGLAFPKCCNAVEAGNSGTVSSEL